MIPKGRGRVNAPPKHRVMVDRQFPVMLVGPGLYRSPQPQLEHLMELKAQGLMSLVNLRAESDESRWYCERAGVAYHHIPVDDWTCPVHEQVEQFLDLMAAEGTRPLLVHCWGGVGRTGLFVSAWRIQQGMSCLEAVQLSDMETPWMGMNAEQREWLRAWEKRLKG